jgi:hypothetical protein
MTENEFFYWLQGYFELTNSGVMDASLFVLSIAQAVCISRHAALVRLDVAAPGKSFNRIEFLAELLHDKLLQPDGRGEFTRKLVNEVAAQFQHVIDPSQGTPEQVAEKQAVHDGPREKLRPYSDPPKFMC